MKYLTLMTLSLASFLTLAKTELKGLWKADLEMQNQNIPFVLEFKSNKKAILYNSSEKIELSNFKITKTDQLIIPIAHYDNTFVIQLPKESPEKPSLNTLNGHWVKVKKRVETRFPVKFIKIGNYANPNRFSGLKLKQSYKTVGRWRFDFYNKTKLEKSAIASFKKDEGLIRGSIETQTGDYRYLEGIETQNNSNDSTVRMYGFDGQFIFALIGKIENDKMDLVIYSGKEWNRRIVGIRDTDFSLSDPYSLTKTKSESVKFQVKDQRGKIKTEKDLLTPGKPAIIQITASWCPNCMDEAKFLKSRTNKLKNIQIIPIAFERSVNEQEAFKAITRMQRRFQLTRPIYLGSYDKDRIKVTDVLPFIQKHISYPTMIFLNKNHEIVQVHTGFSGPATGKSFDKFSQSFDSLIERL